MTSIQMIKPTPPEQGYRKHFTKCLHHAHYSMYLILIQENCPQRWKGRGEGFLIQSKILEW